MRKIIGVIGASDPTRKLEMTAYEVGSEIAKRGHILICGGLSGVMEHAARGAKDADGLTIGILPGNDIRDANPYIDIPVATGMGFARNLIIVQTAQALIAIGGGSGTLSEIAFALKFGKPLVGIGTWELKPPIKTADSPDQAVKMVLQELE